MLQKMLSPNLFNSFNSLLVKKEKEPCSKFSKVFSVASKIINTFVFSESIFFRLVKTLTVFKNFSPLK